MFKIAVSPTIERRLPITIIRAIVEVNELFKAISKNVDIVPVVRFDPLYTKPINLTSHDILTEASKHDVTVSIQLYTQNWFAYKLAPVNAYVLPNEPDIIYLNTRMFTWNKPVEEWKETILHECLHLMDKYSTNTFDHGDNDLKGKGNTAPVKLSQLLATMRLDEPDQLIW